MQAFACCNERISDFSGMTHSLIPWVGLGSIYQIYDICANSIIVLTYATCQMEPTPTKGTLQKPIANSFARGFLRSPLFAPSLQVLSSNPQALCCSQIIAPLTDNSPRRRSASSSLGTTSREIHRDAAVPAASLCKLSASSTGKSSRQKFTPSAW